MEERTPPRHPSCALALGLVSLVWATTAADARITSIAITTKTSPAFAGKSFGSVGQYEQLDGTASGEIDPKDRLNAVIQDIELAPRNSRGMVEYSMDFSILKPIDISLGNHTILYDGVNRGNKSSPALNIGGSATDVGDGFLESEGYTLVWSGWEGDIATGIKISLPVAKNHDGSAITGPVRAEYILSAPASTVSVTAAPPYEAVGTSNSGAILTRRVHQDDAKEFIPNTDWVFADCSTTSFPGTPSTTQVCLNGGFDTNHIYELVYTAKNPTVTGIGFAATRDFISFLRDRNDRHGDDRNYDQGKKSTAGPAPTNPLDQSIDYAIIYGSSQSGRWIRTFLELGFNEGEDHDRVVEGAIPHKASNRGAFNVRFAQPTRLSGTQHTEKQFPGQESPQTWDDYNDKISSVNAGQLDRCRSTNSCPKIFHTVTDTEYWQALMALNTSDTAGTASTAGTSSGYAPPVTGGSAITPETSCTSNCLPRSR